jgi:hypothetical protein
MANVLAEILAGEYAVNDVPVDPSVARGVLEPFIYRPSQLVVGATGILRFDSDEFAAITERIPEADDPIPNSLEVPPLDLVDSIREGDYFLALPTDSSDAHEVMLFEFARIGDDTVLDTVVTPFAPPGDRGQLVGGLSAILASPGRWMRRRRRRRCRPRAGDLQCNSDHCEGQCLPYKKSDEHRVRTLCACCY